MLLVVEQGGIQKTYGKIRGPIRLTISQLTLTYESHVGYPRESDELNLPEPRPEVNGHAELRSTAGISVLGICETAVHELGIRIRAPNVYLQRSQADFAISKGMPPPPLTWAQIIFLKGQNGDSDTWFVDCWVSESTLCKLIDALSRRTLIELGLAVSGSNLLVDNPFDPDLWNQYFLRPHSPDRAFLDGEITGFRLAVAQFDMRNAATALKPESEATDEPKHEEAEQIEPAEATDRSATAILALANELSELRRTVTWIGALAIVALIAVALS